MSAVTATVAVMETEDHSSLGTRAIPLADEEFVKANLKRVFRLIYRIVGNVSDAQDLTQEAFVKALSRRAQLQDPRKSTQWLGRIAVNTALDFVRRRKRVAFEDLDHVVSVSSEESPEQAVLRGEKRVYIEAGLSLLSERERAALILRDVEGLPARDVAEQLGCSPATVRSHIANARVKFRRYARRTR